MKLACKIKQSSYLTVVEAEAQNSITVKELVKLNDLWEKKLKVACQPVTHQQSLTLNPDPGFYISQLKLMR